MNASRYVFASRLSLSSFSFSFLSSFSQFVLCIAVLWASDLHPLIHELPLPKSSLSSWEIFPTSCVSTFFSPSHSPPPASTSSFFSFTHSCSVLIFFLLPSSPLSLWLSLSVHHCLGFHLVLLLSALFGFPFSSESSLNLRSECSSSSRSQLPFSSLCELREWACEFVYV